jgi:hypothetical protein
LNKGKPSARAVCILLGENTKHKKLIYHRRVKMKKSLFVSGMLAMALAFGLALAGCPTGGGGGDGDGSAKKLTITGITDVSGNVRVFLTTDVKKMTGVYINNHAGVGGTGSIANGSVTISLKVVEFPQGESPSITENDWTGTGSYYIWLWQGDTFNGMPLYSAPASEPWIEKISFSTETITVPWNKFGASPSISNE